MYFFFFFFGQNNMPMTQYRHYHDLYVSKMILPGYPNLWYRIHGIPTALYFLLLQLISLSQFSTCPITPFHENHGSRIYKFDLLKFNWSLLESQQPHFFNFFFHYYYLNTSCHGSQYQVEFQFMAMKCRACLNQRLRY